MRPLINLKYPYYTNRVNVVLSSIEYSYTVHTYILTGKTVHIHDNQKISIQKLMQRSREIACLTVNG